MEKAELVEVLLRHNADLMCFDMNKKSAMHYAKINTK